MGLLSAELQDEAQRDERGKNYDCRRCAGAFLGDTFVLLLLLLNSFVLLRLLLLLLLLLLFGTHSSVFSLFFGGCCCCCFCCCRAHSFASHRMLSPFRTRSKSGIRCIQVCGPTITILHSIPKVKSNTHIGPGSLPWNAKTSRVAAWTQNRHKLVWYGQIQTVRTLASCRGALAIVDCDMVLAPKQQQLRSSRQRPPHINARILAFQRTGNRDVTTISATVRKLTGHSLIGPSCVALQSVFCSKSLASAPSSSSLVVISGSGVNVNVDSCSVLDEWLLLSVARSLTTSAPSSTTSASVHGRPCRAF